jgi:hypothetical protein
MDDFKGFVLHPGSGEVALNMKAMIEDDREYYRRRHSNDSDFDKAMNNFTLTMQQDSHTLRYLATINNLTADQTGQTSNQQTTSPIRTGVGDNLAAGSLPANRSIDVAAATVATANAAVASAVGNVALAMANLITASGGVVTAEALAAILPTVVTAAGGASTPSQTQPKPAPSTGA